MFNFSRLLHRKSIPVLPPTPEELLQAKRDKFKEGVRRACEIYSTELGSGGLIYPRFPLEPYLPPKGVCPPESVLAMDSSWHNMAQDSNIGSVLTTMTGITASVLDGMGFPGFPYLIELTQLTEYRDMSERTAAEMVRKWVKFRSVSRQDKTKVIAVIEKELRRHNVRELFRQCATIEGFMGRAMLFPNFGDVAGPELETPLLRNQFKVRRDTLRGFKLVEPITTYPASYNASNALAADYYVPSAWFVYGQKVHASRLLTFISRPLPDLLKPVYNFSGISLSQLAQPYVDYWFGTRDSVGKLLRNFSINALGTDLDVLLSPSGDELLRRSQLFTKIRDNQGLVLYNKNTEEIVQHNVPLSGLDKLQAQAQEHMAAVAKTPLVILLGITPTGLNATAEGDLRVYYDYVSDQQEVMFRHNLQVVIELIMLDQLGYVDEDITFDFVSLFQPTGKELAMMRKSDGDLAAELIQVGVLSPEEVRTKLASDPDSGYDNLDAADVPTAPPLSLGKPKVGGSGEQDSITATENAPDAKDGFAASALDAMRGARRVALDSGGFRGNQFLGGFAEGDDPMTVAMRHSMNATKASQKARQLGTAASHKAATTAHRRAGEAHQRALSLAPNSPQKHVHETYVDAHNAAAANHVAATMGGFK